MLLIEGEILLEARDIDVAIGIAALGRDRAIDRGVLDRGVLREDRDHLVGVGPGELAAGERAVIEAHRAQIGPHVAVRDLAPLMREFCGIEHDGGLVIGIDDIIAHDAHRGVGIDRLRRRGLGREPGIDALVDERRHMLRIAEIDRLDVAEREAELLQRLVHGGVRAGARRGERDLHALEIGERAIAAAHHQILAHEQDVVAVARRRRGRVGDDREMDAARIGAEEPGRRRARADIELARAERRDHLRGGIERDEAGREPLVAEIALLVGDEDADVAARVGNADRHRLRRGRRGGAEARQQQAHAGEHRAPGSHQSRACPFSPHGSRPNAR